MNNRKIMLNYNQALDKSEKYCAYQERCQSEMRNKLYEWGLHSEEVENIIADLITNQFINEERFAKIFTIGKFRIKQWGKLKIKNELKKRKLSEYCITNAIREIPDNEYINSLKKLIQKKAKFIKDTDTYIYKNKLAEYAISKGYESDLVWGILNKIKD
jgi:regulatory protein